MVRQQFNCSVWEHLVIELTKVDHICSRVVGLSGDSTIIGFTQWVLHPLLTLK